MRFMNPKLFLYLLFAFIITSCGTSRLVTTPISDIDNTPLKYTELTEAEEKIWGHLDFVNDTIPGISVEKAYNELIKNKKGAKVIVAVIDSGIDIDHEDLEGVIWTNKNEIPNNNKDDDNNGYVDDVHGWNFLGEAYQEQLEYVRLLAGGNTKDPRYAEAEAEYQKKRTEYLNLKAQYGQIIPIIEDAHKAVSAHLKKENYEKDEVSAIKTEDKTLQQHIYTINTLVFGNDFKTTQDALDVFNDTLKQLNEMLDYNLNKSFNGRKIVGDNPDDFNDRNYGNGNVKPRDKDEGHGTHVAGIVAAERNNGKGVNGVANNVEIMSIRAISNGDEYDKDVALAIRYAADNGAKIVNMSFGKYYSPHSDWVKEAILYAEQKDVLLISGAGNESLNLDNKASYPQDQENGVEFATNFLSVGATEQKYGSGVVANYSNYGKNTIDVFAPGSNIYSTYPNNTYKAEGGTSMSAPMVAGLAALIRSQYPKLSAAQVKQIIMDSGLPLKAKVIVGGNSNNVKPFGELSKSSKLVNAYNALIMASKISN
jgi:subtilisin family serine protease